MSSVSSTTPTTTQPDLTQSTGKSAKDLSNQFLTLLVAQLKNQDPLEPMKNEQFVTELAQLQALDQSQRVAESSQALLLQSSLYTGTSLMGKEVTGMVKNAEGTGSEQITGRVLSVKVEEGSVVYVVQTVDGSKRNLSASDLLTVEESTQQIKKPLF